MLAMIRVAINYAELRKALGISQSAMAQMMCVGRSEVGHYENGRSQPSGASVMLLRLWLCHPELRKRLESLGDDVASIKALGLDVVTDLCARLLEGGAPGLHFYTMNQAGPTLEIWRRLGL